MKVYIGPYEKDHDRDVDIVIDPYDSWNADVTIAMIAAPLLEQLRKEKHGAPLVDDDDVPEHLRSYKAPPKENYWDIDDNHFERYDWMLREVIWALSEIAEGCPGESEFFTHQYTPEDATLQQQLDAIELDKEGLEAYEKRIDHALKLFGKYFRTFWD